MVHVEPHGIVVSEAAYLALVGQNPRLRLERARDGTLIIMPPDCGESARRNAGVTRQLGNWNDVTGTGVVFGPRAIFHLKNGAASSPDAAWLANSTWLCLSAERRRSLASVCPDFVIAIASANEPASQGREKVLEFVENGSALGWLIDPIRRTVEAFCAGRAPAVFDAPATMSGSPALPGFLLHLASVFDGPTNL